MCIRACAWGFFLFVQTMSCGGGAARGRVALVVSFVAVAAIALFTIAATHRDLVERAQTTTTTTGRNPATPRRFVSKFGGRDKAAKAFPSSDKVPSGDAEEQAEEQVVIEQLAAEKENDRVSAHGKALTLPQTTASTRVGEIKEKIVEDLAHLLDHHGPAKSSKHSVAVNCSALFAADSVVQTKPIDALALAREFETRTMTPTLVSQLLAYKARVLGKLVGVNRKLWEPYFHANVSVFRCLSRFPECITFARSEVTERNDTRHGDLLSDHLARHQVVGAAEDGRAKTTASAMEAVLNNNFMLLKCCVEHAGLYDALVSVKHMFDTKKIPFWLTSGTLLAAVRERGVFIPWDTDVDVLVDTKSEDAARKALNDAAVVRTAAKLIDKDHAHGRILGSVYGTKVFRSDDESHVEIWVRQQSRKMQRASLTFPLQPCFLYDLEIRCPANPLQVLANGYGESWCRPCKHRSSNCRNVPGVV